MKKIRVTGRWVREHYVKREVMVAMRDGVRLYTAVYEPVSDAFERDAHSCMDNVGAVDGPYWDGKGSRPVMLVRTPFSMKPYGRGFRKHLKDDMRNFVLAGYVIVYQNVRGRYLSEGDFVNIRPVRHEDPVPESHVTDEVTDTWDTCEWILSGTVNNGRIGVRGMSYPGFYATSAALCGHPAIRAVSPQAPVTDWFMGDDTHHNGALMLSDMYQFGAKFFRTRKGPSARTLPSVAGIEGDDIYTYFLGKGPIVRILEPLLLGKTPFWEQIIRHKDYDLFWRESVPSRHFRNVRPAMLFVGGTFDAEDAYGPLHCWETMNAQSPETENHLVIGPWCHGGWLSGQYDHLDGAAFGAGLSDYFLDRIEWPFFCYHLEDRGEGLKGKIVAIPSSAKEYVPSDRAHFFPPVRNFEEWPPAGVWEMKLCLTAADVCMPDGGHGFSADERNQYMLVGKATSFMSDPKNPVPYYHEASVWTVADYMAGDQRFLHGRPDVLSFSGEALKSVLRVAGPVDVSVWVKTDSTDMDLIVKIIDVRPDGYEMLVRGDVMPARYRNGFDHPEPSVPGSPMRIGFRMSDVFHDFLPGHRIMVQVQASWFPIVALNPQRYVGNQYEAAEYEAAAIEVLCDGEHQSCIALPVLP